MIPDILEYFRLVGYTIIILTSLNGIRTKKFNNILFIGDIVMSLALILSSMGMKLLRIDKSASAPYILTPAVIVWAWVHFWSMVKRI